MMSHITFSDMPTCKVLKKGNKAPRENTGDRYIRRTDRAEGVLVALRRLNNATILFTVLIFVLLHIFLIFFTFITPIRHVVQSCNISRIASLRENCVNK